MSEIVDQLAELNPDALLFEPRTVFDAALIGMTDKAKDHWPRKESPLVAVYDEERCIKAVMEWFGVECGPVRAPLSNLTVERKAQLREDLEAIGFFEWSQQSATIAGAAAGLPIEPAV